MCIAFTAAGYELFKTRFPNIYVVMKQQLACNNNYASSSK